MSLQLNFSARRTPPVVRDLPPGGPGLTGAQGWMG